MQRVLEHHNRKYGTNIQIVGVCEEIYPELRGKLNWDWVCQDNNNSDEIAVEIKRLENYRLREKFSVLNRIFKKLSNALSGKLPGTFLLFMHISEEQHFALNDPSGFRKQKLKNTLTEIILKQAKVMETGEERNISQELRERLPDIVPHDCYCNLQKFDNEGSYLGASPSPGGFAPSGEFQGKDLVEFTKLIQGANKKFDEAKKRGIIQTFLILLEIGFSGAEADVIQKTLQSFSPSDCGSIKYCYFHDGKVLYQIDLPR